MRLETHIQTIDTSSQEVFDFLNDIKNFEKLMPENVSKFELLNDDTFIFALKGMPEIELKKKEAAPHHKIVLGAVGGKLDFSVTSTITDISADKSELQIVFEGEFNAMIGMMVKGPISKLIETWVGNVPKAI